MLADSLSPLQQLRSYGLEQLRKRAGWFIAVGIVLIGLGLAAIASTTLQTITTMASMMFLGWMMVVGGAFQTAHAFACKDWGGFFLDLLVGILYTVVGIAIVVNPAPLAVAFTFLIAILLLAGGVFRIIAGFSGNYPNKPWVLLNGAINILLGCMILGQWPYDALWVIGLFIGIEMLFNGWSLLMLGLMAKKIPLPGASSTVIDAAPTK